MKKLFTFFAVLAIASMSMVQAYQINPLNTKNNMGDSIITTPIDTMEFIITNARFYRYEHSFEYYGTSADSVYYVSVIFNTPFAAGTYTGQMINYEDTRIFNNNTYAQVYVNNALTGAVVTTNETACSVKFNFIGTDSILYKLEMTFTYPTEQEYYEITTTGAKIDSVEYSYDNQLLFTFDGTVSDTTYRFELIVPDTYQEGAKISLDDSTTIYVYNYTTKRYCKSSFRGEMTLTRNDTVWNVVGWVLCRDNVAYYFNCKHPVAVENVTMKSYDVYSEMEAIVICGAEEQNAAIYDVNGRLVYNGVLTSDNARVNVGSGIYFVRVNSVTTKVLVK